MRIFLSYRRDDARHFVDRLYKRLSTKYGVQSVFKDIDSIPLGSDFRRVIEEAVMQCDVLLAVIGEKWLDIGLENGRRRLDDPEDYVRQEIEIAFSRFIPVIPLLTEQTAIPPANLPVSLQKLSFCQSVVVRPDPDFDRDMDRLIHSLDDFEPVTDGCATDAEIGHLSDSVDAAGDALINIIDKIKNLISSGEEGYKDEAAERERKRLIGISATASQLGFTSQFRVIHSLDEYLKEANPTIDDWQRVIEPVVGTVVRVKDFLDTVAAERSDFVLEPAYAKLMQTTGSRLLLLEKLSRMPFPQTENQKKALKQLNQKYKKLLAIFIEAIEQLNLYLKQRRTGRIDSILEKIKKERTLHGS